MWIAVSVFTWHITTNVQTLCWSKSSPSFSSAHSSCISRSINNIFVPQIGMYIRFNMSKTDFIYLKMWCDSVTFCQRGHFFWLTLYICNISSTCIICMSVFWIKLSIYLSSNLISDILLLVLWKHIELMVRSPWRRDDDGFWIMQFTDD